MRFLSLICVLSLVLAGCSDDSTPQDAAGESAAREAGEDPGETVQLERAFEPVDVLDTGEATVSETSIAVSAALFAGSPSVVVVSATDSAGISEATEVATEAGIPLLLLDGVESEDTVDEGSGDSSGDSGSEDGGSGSEEDSGGGDSSADDAASTSQAPGDAGAKTLDEVRRLEATTALAVGAEVEQLLTSELDIDVITDSSDIPDLDDVEGLSDLVVLVHADDTSAGQASAAAATATATSAGATVLALPEPDVRADPEAISLLSENPPGSVLAVGADFGGVEQVSAQVDVAQTGVELPGGGQTVFPGRRLVALYGHPGTAGLGVLGEQDIDASIERAQELAAEFEPLSDVPAVPTFEIIVTVAQASAGADGDYSSETPVDQIRPWVEKAGEEGVYVVLDLQPGRANFLDQAKIYEDLLVMPHVGLALDPEWRLTETQRPLQQIGRVEADEVNSVIDWLAELTAREKLPQKVLVLHQFRISMLQDTDQIDTTRDEVAVLIHMDGQGATGEKDATWQAVVQNAPEGVPFGWKNFYDEDIPMLTPEQTMTREPTPFMISYQ